MLPREPNRPRACARSSPARRAAAAAETFRQPFSAPSAKATVTRFESNSASVMKLNVGSLRPDANRAFSTGRAQPIPEAVRQSDIMRNGFVPAGALGVRHHANQPGRGASPEFLRADALTGAKQAARA